MLFGKMIKKLRDNQSLTTLIITNNQNACNTSFIIIPLHK